MDNNKSEKSDISPHTRAEAALKQSEAKFRRLYNETPVLLHSIDMDGVVVEVNDYWLSTMGYARNEVIGRKVTDFYTDASKTYFYDVARPAFMQDGIVRDIPYQFIRKNGDILDVLLSATAERDADGNIVRSQAVIQDITGQRRTEAALKKSEQMLQTIIDTEPDCIKVIDGESRLIMMNRAGLKMIQADSLDQVRGQFVCPLVAPENQQAFMELTRQVFQGQNGSIEFRMTGMQGRQLWLETHAVPLRNEKDEIIALLGVTRDITERKLAETTLRESEERFRAITMTASDAILLMDDTGKIVYWNPAAERIFGYSPDEAIGRDLHLFLAPGRLHNGYQKGFARFVLTGQGPVVNRSVEMDAVKKDGTEFPIEVSTSSMNINGRWHALGIVRDISERKRLEQELIKNQKLESIGTLAGGIAHDFNNLLQGIFGYLSLAKMTIEQKDKALAMIEQAEQALHQSVNLTTQLLTFSKGGKPLKKVFGLRPVIENAIRFSLSGSSVDHILQIDDDIRSVEADEGQIAQVFQNIIINAEQSMPLGGTIYITARNEAAVNIAGLPHDLKGDLAEITIRDQGTGIPPDHLPRIFDPYFTTKEKGSGLGLATSYAIIRNHGGIINVSSELGKGSCFKIYLPATTVSIVQTLPSQKPAAGRKGRILVMDDEKMVRDVAGALISSLGHEVAFAEHGNSAIIQYQTSMEAGRPFDIVLLDLTIKGGMGGLQTLQRLMEIDPAVKAVVSSGYSDDSSMSDYLSRGFKACLRKPYNIEELRRLLSSMMLQDRLTKLCDGREKD